MIGGLDIATLRHLVTGPGTDSRQWVSYGTVADPGEGNDPIEFDEDEYHQPLIEVILQPSSVGVRCRVAMGVAGDGEGEWYPFIKGDEVIVVLPQGDEKAGPVIVGRLANSLDKFPTRVSGTDTKGNKLGFRRMVAPYVIETAGGYTVRHATTGAFFAITKTGEVQLANGEGAVLHFGADSVGMQNAEGTGVMQIAAGSGNITLQAGSSGDAAVLKVISGGVSLFAGNTALQLTGGGSPPVQHNISLEQVCALITHVLVMHSTMQVPAVLAGTGVAPGLPLVGTAVAVPILPQQAEAMVAAALPLAAAYPLTVAGTAIPAALQVPQSPLSGSFGVGSPFVQVG